MVSLTPWDPIFRPLAFRLDTGLRTRVVPDSDGVQQTSVFRNRGGLGLAFDLGGGALVYGLGEVTGEMGASLDHEGALGAGGSAGLLASTPGDRWGGELFARATYYALGDVTTALSAGLVAARDPDAPRSRSRRAPATSATSGAAGSSASWACAGTSRALAGC